MWQLVAGADDFGAIALDRKSPSLSGSSGSYLLVDRALQTTHAPSRGAHCKVV